MPETAATPGVRTAASPTALRPAALGAVAMAVPTTVVGNEPIAERLGIEPSWIVERTGVSERRVLADGETLVELASEACERALAQAGVQAGAVDMVLAATMSHARLMPSLSSVVVERIGAGNAAALDVDAACSGFVGALGLATAQVESGRAANVLVVGAEQMTSITDPDDRATAALFGDGAGAVLVRPATGAGIGPVILGSDGARAELVTAERDEALIRMQGHDTFREAVNRLSEASEQAAAGVGLALDQIDLFVFHQANVRILRSVGERLGLPEERVVECISRYGNTSAASIPIALASALADGRIEPGDQVLLAAFGGGLTWGATVIEWEGEDA